MRVCTQTCTCSDSHVCAHSHECAERCANDISWSSAPPQGRNNQRGVSAINQKLLRSDGDGGGGWIGGGGNGGGGNGGGGGGCGGRGISGRKKGYSDGEGEKMRRSGGCFDIGSGDYT